MWHEKKKLLRYYCDISEVVGEVVSSQEVDGMIYGTAIQRKYLLINNK